MAARRAVLGGAGGCSSGNIRELRNVVCRALLVRQGPSIDTRDITFDEELVSAPEEKEAPELELPAGVTLEEMMERLERQLIEGTLKRCRYNKERAARELGLARSALFKKLKRWGMSQREE